jgi:hypothetical protein
VGKNDTDLPINHVAVNILSGPAPDKEPLSMATGLRLAPRETKTIEVEGKHLSPTLAYSQINAFITFTDVDGYAWTRHPNGALTPSPWDELQMPTRWIKGVLPRCSCPRDDEQGTSNDREGSKRPLLSGLSEPIPDVPHEPIEERSDGEGRD